jgi:hypothetical protein
MIGEEFIRNKVDLLKREIKTRARPFLEEYLREDGPRATKSKDLEDVELKARASGAKTEVDPEAEERRRNLERNFSKQDDADLFEQREKAKQTSMLHSQGEADHSGSGYHGPGKPTPGKTHSNMAQRNFENHQGN